MDNKFTIKDSGERTSFAGGMVRDVTEGKIDFGLVLDGPMFKRWAEHLTKGAKKYAKRNWMKAEGQEEYDRFRESALRHFLQWYWGDRDEDHGSAVFFNINGAEYLNEKMALAAKTVQLGDIRFDSCIYCGKLFSHAKEDRSQCCNDCFLTGKDHTP